MRSAQLASFSTGPALNTRLGRLKKEARATVGATSLAQHKTQTAREGSMGYARRNMPRSAYELAWSRRLGRLGKEVGHALGGASPTWHIGAQRVAPSA